MRSDSPGIWPLREPDAHSLRTNKSRKWRGSPPMQIETAASEAEELDSKQRGPSNRIKIMKQLREEEERNPVLRGLKGEVLKPPPPRERSAHPAAAGALHPDHDRVWPPSMRERENSPEQDDGTNSIWGVIKTRPRSCYELREIPVNEGFHIMNIIKPGFPLTDHKPFVTPFPLQGPDKWRGVSPPRISNTLRKNPGTL